MSEREPITEETLIAIDDMVEDIKSRRDVRPESVTRALTLLTAEVRRLKERLSKEADVEE